ncbi:MAG: hydroxyacid dehydrogenase [Clostridia bacterium]|nr:hydroxyacid dehydrogenase [Clostridia bacterium]
MVISVFETTEIEKEKLKNGLKGHTLKFFDEPIQNVDNSEYIDSSVICVFVHSKVDATAIEGCKNLKLVCSRSTGIDHIDKTLLDKLGIELKNVPLYGENTVAEHTFALMLALSRKINESFIRTKDGDFSTEGLMGFDLKDKTIGIIGGGRIGLHVARMARSFGMHVRVYDIKQDNFLAEIINFKYLPLDELLKVSDIVSLHLPYNEQTHHIIDEKAINLMKKSALIINTARGGLINTEHLLQALKQKNIYGAGLDVLEGEEFLIEDSVLSSPAENATKIINQNSDLTKLPNVVITPHNAFNSIEALDRIIQCTVKNILDSKI